MRADRRPRHGRRRFRWPAVRGAPAPGFATLDGCRSSEVLHPQVDRVGGRGTAWLRISRDYNDCLPRIAMAPARRALDPFARNPGSGLRSDFRLRSRRSRSLWDRRACPCSPRIPCALADLTALGLNLHATGERIDVGENGLPSTIGKVDDECLTELVGPEEVDLPLLLRRPLVNERLQFELQDRLLIVRPDRPDVHGVVA